MPDVDLNATPQALFDIVERKLLEADQLGTRSCRALFAWWQQQEAKGPPAKADFDFLDHIQIAPNLFLVERLAPSKYHHKLYGEVALDLVGRKWLHRINTPQADEPFARALCAYYDIVMTGGQPMVCHGSLMFAGREHRNFESIDLPLVGADGTPQFLIGCLDTV